MSLQDNDEIIDETLKKAGVIGQELGRQKDVLSKIKKQKGKNKVILEGKKTLQTG